MADAVNEEVRIKNLNALTKLKNLIAGSFFVVDGVSGNCTDNDGNPIIANDSTVKMSAEVLLNIVNDITAPFDPDVPCVVGKTYYDENGKLYECTTAHSGAWNPNHFEATSVENIFAKASDVSALQTKTANISASIAPEFVPNVTTALANHLYMYNGAFFRAKDDYSGVWDSSKFTTVSIGDVLNMCFRNIPQTLKNKFELFVSEYGMTWQSLLNASGDVADSNKVPTGIVDWILPTKVLLDNLLFNKVYLTYGSYSGAFDPYENIYKTRTRMRTSFVYTGKNGAKFSLDYGQSNLVAKLVFYFDLDDESGRLTYSSNVPLSSSLTEIELSADKIAVLVFADKDNASESISSSAFEELSISFVRNKYEVDRNDFGLFNLVDTFYWVQGGINSQGVDTTPTSGYYYNRIKTDFYEVSETPVIIKFNDSAYILRHYAYDSDKNFSAFTDYSSSPAQISTTVGSYKRFCLIRKDSSNIVPAEGFRNIYSVEGLITNLKVYEKPLYESDDKFLTGKKVVFIGDSITAGAGAGTESARYVNKFGAITGAEVVNLGVNGTCIANNTKNGLGSSRFVTRATSENLSDADLVVVFGGTNDLSYDNKAIGDHFSETTITASGNIGTKQLGAVSDTDTFAGALHDLITTIQTNVSVNTPILFLTPLHRNNNTAANPNSYQCNSNGDFMKDFVDAIKDICGFYAIPVLDMYSDAELNPLVPNYSGLFSDGLHPNANGHRVIAERIASFVKNNISFI